MAPRANWKGFLRLSLVLKEAAAKKPAAKPHRKSA